MNRVKAVRQALDGREESVYLEIGVCRGSVFRQISAAEKIAVDPAFRVSARSRRRAERQARATHFFDMTSDDFFANETAFLERRGVDVALIDGLHTYGQAVRDVENTLQYLRPDGVLILHDCNPATPSIACPAASYDEFFKKTPLWSALRGWSGDVWKAIVHLRSTRSDLRVAVLNCDFGLGVVRRGSPESRLHCSTEQISALTYADLALDRQKLLNLQPPDHFHDFLSA
ncbi:biotin carboxyl carrier protein [Mycobacterium sp. E802]|uniref:class I SAM-dependent methyltransferase n=1 Tax=Mycobacterium sp. E802 TaxID=1834152 RepID=UPI0008003876|nr:class I SAM-dependent methyltransferase [Mycobacterium sp. E802]OBG89576.1 biotin carboxyl carrier protein [Mycobacterium sp. E802]